ncbi:MAG: pirin family protein [Bradymonadales bacterium]|nr:MAG: pirin family protein [Bradymonadales bacterium]
MSDLLKLHPKETDLGGFSVRRLLPSFQKKMIGPFIFLDHIGPAKFEAGKGVDVRPHPHIGLATVTYLFEGELHHRDSLGNSQVIRPGDVNWMVAGSGIVHSERSPKELRQSSHSLYGLQFWVALPKEKEEMAASFHHTPSERLPTRMDSGCRIKLIAGSLAGLESPIQTQSPLFYAALDFEGQASFELPEGYRERAVYLLEGDLELSTEEGSSAEKISAGELAVLPESKTYKLRASQRARAIVFGGEPLDGDRHIAWNFVSSDAQRISKAKMDWEAGKFPKVPGDEEERIPLPKS